jgi:hypothetical protein
LTSAFLGEFVLQARQISIRGWGLAASAGFSLALMEGVTWHWSGPHLLGIAALTILGATTASYVLCMWLLGQRVSLLGGARFIGSFFVLMAPLIASVVLLVMAAWGYQPILVLGALPLLLIGMVVAALFVAWPVLQATEARFVSLARVFRATEGYRWSLFGASFVIGAINRIELDPGTSARPEEILMASAVSAVVGTISVVVFACVWATAWRFAVRADSGLVRERRGGQPLDEAQR